MVEQESTDAGQQIVRTFKVKVLTGPDAGKVHCATQEPVVVGSHDRAHLRLTDPEVSLYHLELTPLVSGFAVRDLDSETGTFAGNVRLKQGTLPFGATLDLGRTRLLVEPADILSTDPVSTTHMRLKDARAQAVAAFERTYLEEILDAHAGNVTLAARAAGVDRVHFYRLLWRNGLRRMGSAS